MTHRALLAAALVSTLSLAACGGKVVFERGGDGSGGDGATGQGGEGNNGAGMPSTSSVPDTNTGPSGCIDHLDCGPSAICQFATGACIPACGFDIPCLDGFVCDECATSSCLNCADCVAGCIPDVPQVFCDDHDDCGSNPGDSVCVFFTGTCAQRCGAGSPPCPPSLTCEPCATSSCPGCDDCIGACVKAFDQ